MRKIDRKKIAPEKTTFGIHAECVMDLLKRHENILITREKEIFIDPAAQLPTGDIFGYDKRYLQLDCDKVPPCGYILKNQDGGYKLWDNNGLDYEGIISLSDIGLCDSETCNKWNAINAKEKIRLQLQTETKCGLCASANITVEFVDYHEEVSIFCGDCGATQTRYIRTGKHKLKLDKPEKCELCGTTNTTKWEEISSFDQWNLPEGITLKLDDVTFKIGEKSHRLCKECYKKHEIKIDNFERNLAQNSDKLGEQKKNQRLAKLQKMTKAQLIEEITDLKTELEEARS